MACFRGSSRSLRARAASGRRTAIARCAIASPPATSRCPVRCRGRRPSRCADGERRPHSGPSDAASRGSPTGSALRRPQRGVPAPVSWQPPGDCLREGRGMGPSAPAASSPSLARPPQGTPAASAVSPSLPRRAGFAAHRLLRVVVPRYRSRAGAAMAETAATNETQILQR